ncbi:MAG: RNA-binding protein [Prochlorococcaceae cyanobacterium]
MAIPHSFKTERRDLLDLFGQYGQYGRGRPCHLPLDRETGRKQGFSFIELSCETSQQRAIDGPQDGEWMGSHEAGQQARPPERVRSNGCWPLLMASGPSGRRPAA